MAQVIDKNLSLALPLQVRNILAKRIESAYYQPGRKIDSIRRLSNEFNVSTVTVIEAMKLLEDEGYVVRIPASGIFVNEKFGTAKKQLKAVFAFPEKSISPEFLTAESWAISSEIFRGLLDGGMECKVQVNFEYFQDHATNVELQRQLKRLRHYDAAIFTGRQLIELQKLYGQTNPAFQFTGENTELETPLIRVGYCRDSAMRQLVEHAVACKYRTVGIISLNTSKNFYSERRADFVRICHKYGLETPENASWEFFAGDVNNGRLLREKFSGELPDMIFCNHAEFVHDVYEATADCGIKFGNDVGLVGIATGWTFKGLIPALTYVQTPHYRLAKKLIQEVADMQKNGKTAHSIIISDLKLIQGKSTRII